jgi:hypothetical protein
MSIFGGSKNKKEFILVLDIGSSSVGAVLFYTEKPVEPFIVFSTVEAIPLGEDISAEKLLTNTTQTLSLVLKKVFSAKLGSPSRIFCVLSSPWYVSQSRVITFNKNTPFIFTDKLADSLLEREIKIFQEENSKKYPNRDNQVRVIELKNVKISLNGYETTKPVNQKAKELEMMTFISMCEERVCKKIEETISKYFQTEHIKFSSFGIAFYTLVRDKYTPKDNFLLVDAGGEVTDIMMVKKNILKGSISFPLGTNFIIRRLSVGLKCSLDEARSFLSIFKEGHAEVALAKKISLVLSDIKKEWLKKFQESLADLSNDISIPSLVFVATDRDWIDFFAETIKTEQFTQYTLAESKFEILPINTKLLHGLVKFKDEVTRDPFLIVDTAYVNSFLNNLI